MPKKVHNSGCFLPRFSTGKLGKAEVEFGSFEGSLRSRHSGLRRTYIRLGSSHLSLYDISHLHLPAELIVLSGCATGLNVVAPGDELMGLVRGLLQAGAQSLILSLWGRGALDRSNPFAKRQPLCQLFDCARKLIDFARQSQTGLKWPCAPFRCAREANRPDA